jgi:hypothetical protein
MAIAILVAQRQARDPLPHELLHAVLDDILVAFIPKTTRQPLRETVVATDFSREG